MRGKKSGMGILTLVCILACSTMTVFAADEAAEYVPKMYASFWALVPRIVAISAGINYEGSLQFIVRRYFDRRHILIQDLRLRRRLRMYSRMGS